MAKISVSFRQADGRAISVEADAGMSLMEAAQSQGVAGIAADCGGACSCATCHVYFETEWFGVLEPMAEEESAMLEIVEERFPTSRLSCQIRLNAALDGIEALVPAEA